MRRRKPRHLTAEENALWKEVAQQAVPMHPARKAQKPALPAKKPDSPRPSQDPLPSFRIGQTRIETARPHDLAPPIGAHVAAAPVTMDRKSFARMKRGKLVPEARIDLHGMTLHRAHPALTRFIQTAHAQDRRLVLVITGKGRNGGDDGPIPQRRGILKHQVPHWLQTPPLSAMVLQVAEAHLKHGGTGAYYVYLRRRR